MIVDFKGAKAGLTDVFARGAEEFKAGFFQSFKDSAAPFRYLNKKLHDVTTALHAKPDFDK